MDYVATITQPIEAEMTQFRARFEQVACSYNPLLQAVADHTLSRGGKRMRPMLTLLMAKLCGGIKQTAYHTAVALELLHTASLMHDDVVDESDMRRGQPSVRSAFSNKTAVLSGDYYLATALCEVVLTHHLKIIDIVAHLGQSLAGGELLQLSTSSHADTISHNAIDPFSEESYYRIIRQKTASLFATCAQTGALAANASDEIAEKARLFGEYIGICFQIRDDIFDYFDSSEIGKPTGNDLREGKLTLPIIYALQTCPNATALSLAAQVRSGTISTTEIALLIDFTKAHGGIDYAMQAMYHYRDRALATLKYLPHDDAIHTALTAYANCVVERKK